MLDHTYISSLKKGMLSYAEKRRDIIKLSGDALHIAKRSIFAMHRGDMKEAKEKLDTAEKMLKSLQTKFKSDKTALDEGSLKEALEEFTEAHLLYQFLTKRKIGKVPGIVLSAEGYIGGLADVPGELQRYAIKLATERDAKGVMECKKAAEEIVGALIEFNLTKYLRNKFDQAKQSLRKIEQVVYDLSLRNDMSDE